MEDRKTREGRSRSLVHRVGRSALAIILCASMLLSTGGAPVALAVEQTKDQTVQENAAYSASVAEMMRQGEEEYPNGAFGLANTQVQMTEGNKDQTISVVRMGDATKEASVIFHMIDVSTKYGEDYQLYIVENGKKQFLTAPNDNLSMMEKYGDQMVLKSEDELAQDQQAAENAQNIATEAQNAQAAVDAAEIAGVQEQENAQADNTQPVQDAVPVESVESETNTAEEDTEDTPETMSDGQQAQPETPDDEQAPAEPAVFAEGDAQSQEQQVVPAEETSEDQSEVAARATDLIGSETTTPADGLNSLERAQSVQKGVLDKNKSWREVSDEKSAEYKEAEEVISNGYNNIEKAIRDLGGLTYEVKFAPGENTKEIFIHVPDDNVSDGEVQAMFALTDGLGGELSDSRDGYLNIKDNEKTEPAAYAFAKDKVSINAGEESVTLTLKKTAGTESLSTVTVIATDGTAKCNEVFKPYAESLVFAPGCESKDFTIPLVNTVDPEEPVTFYVGIGKEDGRADRDAGLAEVTVNPAPDPGPRALKSANPLRNVFSTKANSDETVDRDQFGWDDDVWFQNFKYDECRIYRALQPYYSMTTSISESKVELQGAKRIRFFYFYERGTGSLGSNDIRWGIVLNDGAGEKIELPTLSYGSKSVYTRNNSGVYEKQNVSYIECALEGVLKRKVMENGDKGCRFYASFRSPAFGYGTKFNLTRAEVVFEKITYSTNNDSKDLNYYLPKTYDGYTGENQRHGVFMGKTLFMANGNEPAETGSCRRPSDWVNVVWKPTGEDNEYGAVTTENNIEVEKYYANVNKKLTEIKLDGGRAVTKYMHPYEDTKNNVELLTKFKPKKVTIKFQTQEGVQFNKFNTKDELKNIAALDTVKLTASPTKKNNAVAGFSAVMKSGSGTTAVPIKYEPGRKDTATLDLSYVVNGATITVTALSEPLSLKVMLDPATKKTAETNAGTKAIVQRAEVLFTPTSGSAVGAVTGNWENVMSVPNVEVEGKYTIIGNMSSASDSEGKPEYEYVWRNGSADTNGDGIFSAEEKKRYYGSADVEVETFRGDAYPFTITRGGASKIYYNLESVNKNKEPADTGGQVSYEEPILATGKRKKQFINGVTVTGFGTDTVTNDTGKNAYLLNGGSGFYLLASDLISRYGRYLLNYTYNRDDGSSMLASMVTSPSEYRELKFSADSVMKVKGLRLQVVSNTYEDKGAGDIDFSEDDYEDISDTAFFYCDSDRQHKISFTVESAETSLQPQKVVIRFRKKNDEELTGLTKTITLTNKDAGKVKYEFTPEKLDKIEVGVYMTIQVIDQLGKKYPEQNTGYEMHKSLGRKDLDSTFSFGAGTAIKIVGLIFGTAGQGWNGRLDEHAANVTVGSRALTQDEYEVLDMEYRDAKKNNQEDIMEILDEQMAEHQNGEKTVKTMTLCIGMNMNVYENKNSKGTVDDFAKAKAKKDVDLAKKQKAYSEALIDPKKSADDCDKLRESVDKAQQDADKAKTDYENAVDKKANQEETITSLAKAVKITVGYTYLVTFDYDRAAKTWYFEKMMLTMKGKGEFSMDWQFATPVGITIGIGFKVSGALELSLIMKANAGHKYFLSDVEGKKRLDNAEDKVNFFAFAKNSEGEALDYSGAVAIMPAIEIHASAEFSVIKVTGSGSVGFNLQFFTDPKEKDNGTVTLSAKIGVKVTFIEANWTFHADPISLFGGKSQSVDDILAGDTYLYGSGDRFDMIPMPDVKNRKGWQGGHTVNLKSLDENPDGVAQDTLQEDVYSDANPKLMKINESGDYLGVFLDADGSRENEADQAAVFYTIYDHSTGKWSEPIVLERDGLLDTDVKVADLGDRGLFVTWSTANKSITDDVSHVDKMNSLNLHGAFFDKGTRQFVKDGDAVKILELTKDTDGAFGDDYGDMSAEVITDGNEMLIYYSKNYYEVSDAADGEAVGDVVWPTDTFKVYRTYRFAGATGTDGTLIEHYNELKDVDISADILASGAIQNDADKYNEYEHGFYGQVFLSVAPDIYVDETMDEDGQYWAEGTEPTIYAGTQVKGEIKKNDEGDATIISDDTNVAGTNEVAVRTAPYLVDSDVISYNGLGIFAFTADYDNDLTTVNDRDVYFQIYDFDKGTMSHPIMVTADSVQDGNVRLFREAFTNGEQKQSTMLAWLHEGQIQTLNLSDVVRNLGESKVMTVNGRNVSYYLIEKTKDAGYVPPQIIVRANHLEESVADGKETIQSSEEAAKKAPEISSFDVFTDGGCTWYVWTDQDVDMNDGIDPNSAEATNAKNRKLETQLYMVRHDLKNTVMTAPVQITSEDGANYESVSVGVNADGTLRVLARKSMSHVVDATEFNSEVAQVNQNLPQNEQQNEVPAKQFTPYNAPSDKKDLVSLAINPVSKAKLKNTDNLLDDLNAGETLDFSFDVLNDGIDTLSGLTLTGTDVAGNGVLFETKQIQGTNEDTGEVITVETRGDQTDTLNLGDIIGGYRKTVYGSVTASETDADSAITLTLKDKSGNVLDSKTVKKTFKEELAVTDLTVTATPQRDVFDASCVVKNVGSTTSAEQTLTIGVKTTAGKDKALKKITVPALNPGESTTQSVEMFNLKSASYFTEAEDANGGLIEQGTFYAAAGEGRNEYVFIRDVDDIDKNAMDQVKSIGLGCGDSITVENGGRGYTDVLVNKKSMMNRETRTKGVRTILESSDPTIFQVDQEGTIHGMKEGTATLTAYVMPANTVSVATITGVETEGALVQTNELDKLTSIPNSLIKKVTATVTVKPVTSVKQGGITYTLSGGKVTASKSDSSIKTATIPATMEFNGTSYKVTAIAKNAFKDRKKLTKVTIGKNVTSIGANAFLNCAKLNTAAIGANVTTIGASAFQNCTTLAKISIPKKVTKVNAKTFMGCEKLKTATIGTNVTIIGASAFQNCVALTKITVPKKVTRIDAKAFMGCKKLKTATIGVNVKTIGAGAFQNCAALTKIAIPKKVTVINASTFKGCKKLAKAAIGANVKTVGASAFQGCVKLKVVTIPSKVTSIGKNAFYGDKLLVTITFKRKKAPKIGANAFKGIAKKASFKVPMKALKGYKKVLKKKVGVTTKMKVKKS